MIPDNVTLIVKAPNQQIEDQNIECLSSWTVKQLKGHLSQVYPSKPSADEQKIIYSGQLLDDSLILKDVLRTYETQLTQFTHTMHLVCTPKRNMMEEKRKPLPVVTESVANDGVRRRNVEPPVANVEPAPRPEIRQNDQNHTVEMQNYLHSFVNYGRVPPYPANYNIGASLPMPTDAASMANHMLMMQQAYMQYMQQYANMWQAGGNVAPGTQPRNVVNEVPPQPPAAAPAPAEEPEEARRDWLDTVYAASRLIVLASLVYLYSSPLRLLLVLMLCAAGYLHQVGFFRDFAANENPLPQAPANRAPNANNADNAVNADNANNAVNADTNAPPPPMATPPPNADNQHSLLAVTWMIFSSFLASLIPEMNQ